MHYSPLDRHHAEAGILIKENVLHYTLSQEISKLVQPAAVYTLFLQELHLFILRYD